MMHHRLHRVVPIVGLVTSLMAQAVFAASQEPLKSLSALTVVDAHGTKVGQVISLRTLPTILVFTAVVAFEVAQQPFVLLVSPSGYNASGPAVFFASGNCSGTPLVSAQLVVISIIELAAVSAPGHTVYLSDPDATPQRFIPFVGTQLAPDGTCQPANFDNIEMLAARPVVDLDTLFVPPFSVR
jgi:hypothetical protein